MISRRAWSFVFLAGAALIGLASAARLSALQPEPAVLYFQTPPAVQSTPPEQTAVVLTQAAIEQVDAKRQLLLLELQKLEAQNDELARIYSPGTFQWKAYQERMAQMSAEIERLNAITRQSAPFMQLKNAMAERQKELEDKSNQLANDLARQSQLRFVDKELSRTFRPEDPPRTGVEEQLKEVEREIASINGNAAPPHMVMFAMAVTNDRTVQLQGEDSVGFASRCADCTFFQWESGQSPQENGMPGVLIHLQKDGKHVELTCRSSVCRVIEYMGKEHNLSIDDKIVVPVSGPTIVKFLG